MRDLQKKGEYNKRYWKKWYLLNRKKYDEDKKLWRKNNPDKVRKYALRYRIKNIDRIRERDRQNSKIYYQEHKSKKRSYERKKREIDFKFHLDDNFGALIRKNLKGGKGGYKWKKLVNYTINELIQRLEYQFDDKMNWQNYGSYWHIDHKKPKSLFNYNSFKNQTFKDCWCLTNLQPLEAKKNLIKGNKFQGL